MYLYFDGEIYRLLVREKRAKILKDKLFFGDRHTTALFPTTLRFSPRGIYTEGRIQLHMFSTLRLWSFPGLF